jgi:hypothetical protein
VGWGGEIRMIHVIHFSRFSSILSFEVYRNEHEVGKYVCKESSQQIVMHREIEADIEIEDYDYYEEEFDP